MDGCIREQLGGSVLLKDTWHADWGRQGSNHQPSNRPPDLPLYLLNCQKLGYCVSQCLWYFYIIYLTTIFSATVSEKTEATKVCTNCSKNTWRRMSHWIWSDRRSVRGFTIKRLDNFSWNKNREGLLTGKKVWANSSIIKEIMYPNSYSANKFSFRSYSRPCN